MTKAKAVLVGLPPAMPNQAPQAGPFRLHQGGHIDHAPRIQFRFNGRTYTGRPGDTLASALLANCVRTVGRSFKFHRPRGIFSAGLEEPCALLQIGEGASAISSVRAPLVELTHGLKAYSQAGWPSVNFDFGRALDAVAPLWSAGFYNKTFMWPSWHTYELIIRRLAGLGRAPSDPDPDRYEVGNLHCDVLVIGGGLAGLGAARDAGRRGARVVLVDQDHQLGGEAMWGGAQVEGLSAGSWLTQILGQLRQMPDVRTFTRTTAVSFYDHNVVALLECTPPPHAGAPRERYWIVRAAHAILATGAIEQPLIFGNYDRPGIMLASAARQYLLRYGVSIGSRVLIATNNDSAYTLAQDLTGAGVDVLAIADTRHEVPQRQTAEMRERSIAVLPGTIPIDTSGFSALRSVTLGRLSTDRQRIDSRDTFRCDALAVSGGFNPTLHLYAQAGGKLSYDDPSGALQPATQHPCIEIIGKAAKRIPIGPRISPVGDSKRKWVDLLHDVTVADLELALRENFISVEHVKRYTTVGMAADQGKTSAAPTLEVLSQLRGIAAHELGHTTLRPPFMPVTLGAIAGREISEHFAPHRLLPMHDWHLAHGALMHDFGEWRRPVAYVRTCENRDQAMRREAHAVRTSVGLFDGSSLGKIEIHGPDALQFLDRFYINDLTTLKPQRIRYGLMLRESGIIFDDGTVVMLAPDRFVITTTSGNAGRVGQWLEEWHQCEWPQLRVAIMPVTEQWATVSLAGPKSRAVLAKLPTDVDLSAVDFPHLSMREGTLLDMPARIYRVSFTGELTYEINVPANRSQALWNALMNAGAGEGLQPVGMDAVLLLRLEKGFLHVGSDTDGTTVPDDVGWGEVAVNKKRGYIGKRSLMLPENLKSDRLQLIGLLGKLGTNFVTGSHLRVKDSTQVSDGWITSVGAMTLTNEPIALAVLRGGRARIGVEVNMYDAGALTGRARVVNPSDLRCICGSPILSNHCLFVWML
jgi:sarcosine oxidase, subunit alpha